MELPNSTLSGFAAGFLGYSQRSLLSVWPEQCHFRTETSAFSAEPSAPKQVFCWALWRLALCMKTLELSCRPEGNTYANSVAPSLRSLLCGVFSVVSSSLVTCPTNSGCLGSPALWALLFSTKWDSDSLLGIWVSLPQFDSCPLDRKSS